jgi:hypothetical protein
LNILAVGSTVIFERITQSHMQGQQRATLNGLAERAVQLDVPTTPDDAG